MDIQQHTSIQYHPEGCKRHNKGKKERKNAKFGRKKTKCLYLHIK